MSPLASSQTSKYILLLYASLFSGVDSMAYSDPSHRRRLDPSHLLTHTEPLCLLDPTYLVSSFNQTERARV
jgi:hypothetical protein